MDIAFKEKLIAFVDDDYDEEDEGCFKLVHDGEWVDDGKYSYRYVVVSHEDKFYRVDYSRSGSHFTDYEVELEEIYEVIPKEIKKTVWKRVV